MVTGSLFNTYDNGQSSDIFQPICIINGKSISRLTVVSREAKEEVPCDGLSTNAREYFTRTNLDKIKNAPTDEP